MGTMISSGTDVVGFLKEQHQQIKAMLSDVLVTNGEARQKAFIAVRRLLAVHETAEEEIVHPAARRALADGAAIVDARLNEENEAKKALTELETLDVDSADFETKFQMLTSDVIAHAESEEQEEFIRLANVLDQSRLERMRKAAEFAEKMAPTRPHPGVESAGANLLAGPFASMVDRTRDALTGKN